MTLSECQATLTAESAIVRFMNGAKQNEKLISLLVGLELEEMKSFLKKFV